MNQCQMMGRKLLSVISGGVMPSKGDLISMNLDGTDRSYRVLKNVSGTIYEVLAMFEASTSQAFGSSNNTYANSSLDTYLNSTWYSALTSTAKTAIVDKSLTQDSWYWGTSGSPVYSGTYGSSVPGAKSYSISKGSDSFAAIGDRHIYALSVQEVIDYLSDENMRVDKTAILRNQNIWNMFFNTSTKPSVLTYPWLRSADAESSGVAWSVIAGSGRVDSGNVFDDYAARPALQIDLSKIQWSLAS